MSEARPRDEDWQLFDSEMEGRGWCLLCGRAIPDNEPAYQQWFTDERDLEVCNLCTLALGWPLEEEER